MPCPALDTIFSWHTATDTAHFSETIHRQNDVKSMVYFESTHTSVFNDKKYCRPEQGVLGLSYILSKVNPKLHGGNGMFWEGTSLTV